MAALPTHDRAFWKSLVVSYNFRYLNVGLITKSLGLKRKNDAIGATRGPARFNDQIVTQLADAITLEANKLPTDIADLLEIAVSPDRLSEEVDSLLQKFGQIWGGQSQREWLFQSADGVEVYSRDLYIGVQQDRALIKELLRQWILVKAVNVAKLFHQKTAAALKVKAMLHEVEKQALGAAKDGETGVEFAEHGHHASDAPARTSETWQIQTLPAKPGEMSSPIKDRRLSTAAQDGNQEATSSSALQQIAAPSPAISTMSPTRGTNHAAGSFSVTDALIQGGTSDEADGPQSASIAAGDAQSSTVRSARSTLKPMMTYNETILNGRAKHTPTKYLEKHHKNVLRRPLNRVVNVGAANPGKDNVAPSLDTYSLDMEQYQDEARQSKCPTSRKRKAGANTEDTSSKKLKATPPPTVPGDLFTTTLLGYLKMDFLTTASESSQLASIESDFLSLTPNLRTLIRTAQLSTAFTVVFPAFLVYRRAILSVRQRLEAHPDIQSSDVHVKIQRSRLLTELRIARDKFVATWDDCECQAENIICMAFERMQASDVGAGQVRDAIQDGFRRLDDGLLRMGNELGCGRWIFGV